eukprot:m.1326019 g.1326019  ORF g.1326019 m.1326019 type:complete len:1484 (+) comp24854_c0_seq6:183-4634(+)
MLYNAAVMLAFMATAAHAQFFSTCNMCGDGGDKPSIQSITFRNTGASPAFVSVSDVSCSGCGTVAPGGEIVLLGSGGSSGGGSASSGMGMGSTGFPTNTEFTINGQSLELHTSCSRPLGVGTTVGQLTLVAFVTSARNSASCGSPPSPPSCVTDLADCPVAYCPFCVDRFRPLNLRFRLNGGGTAVSPPLAGESSNGEVSGGMIGGTSATVMCGSLFSGVVSIGSEFTINNVRSDGNDVTCNVMGSGSQSITFHVSCSRSLYLGQNFGAIQLSGGVLQNRDDGSLRDTATACPAPACELCDENPPVPVGPDRTVECDGMGNMDDIAEWLDDFSCTDAEDPNPVLVYGPNPLEFVGDTCSRTATATWTCTDSAGNSASITRSFTIEDTSAPVVVTPPAGSVAECDGSGNLGELTAWLDDNAGFRARDLCQAPLACPPTAPPSSSSGGYGPVISDGGRYCDCPRDSMIVCGADGNNYLNPCFAFCHTYQAAASIGYCHSTAPPVAPPTACPDALVYTHTDPVFAPCTSSGSASCDQCAEVTFRATDACGNYVERSAVFRIRDTSAPVISTAAASEEVECNSNTQTAFAYWLGTHGGAAVSDACQGTLSWSTIPAHPQLPASCNSIVRVQFRATDACGRHVSTEATFAVRDDTAPTINTAASDLSVECDGNGNVAQLAAWVGMNGGASASDSCTLGQTCSPGYNQAYTDHSMCTACASYALPYAPVCYMGHSQYDHGCYAHCHHQYDPDYSYSSIVSGPCSSYAPVCTAAVSWTHHAGVTGPCPGYVSGSGCPMCTPYTFTATDACGNSATTTANFIVDDNAAPSVTGGVAGNAQSSADLLLALSAWRDSNGFTNAMDSCDDDLTLTSYQTAPFTGSCPETSEWTFIATDDCGNSANVTLPFTVQDRDDPVVSGGDNLMYNCDTRCSGYSDMVWDFDASQLLDEWLDDYGCLSATDCSAVAWTYSFVGGRPTSLCGASGSVVFTATDANGQSTSTTLTYNFPRIATPPPPPPVTTNCNACDRSSGSKPSLQQLRMRWTGAAPASVSVSNALCTGCGVVQPGDVITLSGGGGSSSSMGMSGSSGSGFSTNTEFVVNGVSMDLHTSCSQPLTIGVTTVLGLVVDGFVTDMANSDLTCPTTPPSSPYPPSSPSPPPSECMIPGICGAPPRPGPTPPPTAAPPPPPPAPCFPIDVCPSGRPNNVIVRYVPGTTITQNQEGKAYVTGAVSGPVSISCDGVNANPAFSVAEGSTVVLSPSGSRFDADTTCTLTGAGSQTINFHTSCSKPLFTGNVFGSFVIVGFNGVPDSCLNPAPTEPPVSPPTNAPTTSAPTTAPPTGACSPSVCEHGSGIRRLTLEFTSNVGQGSFHPSQDSRVQIEELTSAQNSARVVVSSTASASGFFHGAATNDFRVRVGERFSLVGARSGEFGASVLIKVAGKKIRFGTNCNAEVSIGDVFGSVQVAGYENDSGSSCGASASPYRMARSLRGRQL